MKRLLTILVILLLVLVAGVAALVLLVNPNDFRNYMVIQVEQKSGYKLDPGTDFRWHVWPQLSIISGRMSLTPPGEKKPVISAENMRLDVELWPLLSRQLVVKQVMLNRAVIRLTPGSTKKQATTDIAVVSDQNNAAGSSKWNWDIGKIEVIDSLLVWQETENDQVTVRDINLFLEQDELKRAKLTISSRINRNQRELMLAVMADVDIGRYPHQVVADINKLSYTLTGADLPVAGITGTASLKATYQDAPRKIQLDKVMLSVNDNELTGSFSGDLGEVPQYLIDLSARKLNIDAIAGGKMPPRADSNRTTEQSPSTPVIVAKESPDRALDVLKSFNAQLRLAVNEMVYSGLMVNDFTVRAINHQGRVRVNTLSGKVAEGDFSIPVSLDVTGKKASVMVEPVINQMELHPLLKAMNLTQNIKGKFSVQGQLSGEGLNYNTLNRTLQGKLEVNMAGIKMDGLNIQQLIQQAIAHIAQFAQSPSQSSIQDGYQRYTEISQLQASMIFNKEKTIVDDLRASSEAINLTGKGNLSIPAQQCDMNFDVRVLQGWQGNSDRIKKLQSMTIPLHVYGPWNNLKYQLNVENLLRNELKEKAKKALDNWLESQSHEENNALKSLLDKL